MVGIALLITGRIVKPDPEDLRREKELRDKLLAKSLAD